MADHVCSPHALLRSENEVFYGMVLPKESCCSAARLHHVIMMRLAIIEVLNWQVCRADVVPRLSAASVEGAFLELAAASPVRTAAAKLGRRVTSTLEGLKVCPVRPRIVSMDLEWIKWTAAPV